MKDIDENREIISPKNRYLQRRKDTGNNDVVSRERIIHLAKIDNTAPTEIRSLSNA